MATITNLPGTLNLAIRKSDSFRTTLDFDTSATGVTVTSELVSAVTGQAVTAIGTTVTNAATGEVVVAMTDTQTSMLDVGTYRWRHIWDYPANSQKTMLTGFVEVSP